MPICEKAMVADLDRVASSLAEDDEFDLSGLKRAKTCMHQDVSNNYTLHEPKIGEGQFAQVFKATHNDTKKTVAVKIIDRKETGADVETVTDKEIEIMLAIDHQNCVTLLEIYQTDDQVQLVMEFLQGGDLFDHILSNKKFGEADAQRCMEQICAGVEHLHSHRIIHRDLKPENILLVSKTTANIDIRVADFGLGKMFPDEVDVATTRCGTPGYVAPEVLNRKPYDYKVDSWALGVIAYILLSGAPPFPLDMKPASLRKVNSGDFKFPKSKWASVSDAAKDFIRKLIVVDPDNRMTLQETMAHDWLKKHPE